MGVVVYSYHMYRFPLSTQSIIIQIENIFGKKFKIALL